MATGHIDKWSMIVVKLSKRLVKVIDRDHGTDSCTMVILMHIISPLGGGGYLASPPIQTLLTWSAPNIGNLTVATGPTPKLWPPSFFFFEIFTWSGEPQTPQCWQNRGFCLKGAKQDSGTGWNGSDRRRDHRKMVRWSTNRKQYAKRSQNEKQTLGPEQNKQFRIKGLNETWEPGDGVKNPSQPSLRKQHSNYTRIRGLEWA